MKKAGLTAIIMIFAYAVSYAGLEEAVKMIKQGDYSGAEQEILSVLESNPKNARAYIVLADMYLKLARYRETATLMLKAIKEVGATPSLLKRLGSAYLNLGDYDRALSTFEYANSLSSGDYAILNYIGLVHLKRDEFYLAEVAFRAAIAFGGKFPFVYNNLGVAYEYQKNYAKAVQMYSKALAMKPDYVKARNNLERVKKLMQEQK